MGSSLRIFPNAEKPMKKEFPWKMKRYWMVGGSGTDKMTMDHIFISMGYSVNWTRRV